MKYIDAERLRAEIERRREKCADIAADERNEEVAEYYRGKEVAYDETSSLITSLQQEQQEVDFEKEFAHEYAIYHLPTFILASLEDGTELIDFIYKTARHFAEWGAIHLNARKEK